MIIGTLPDRLSVVRTDRVVKLLRHKLKRSDIERIIVKDNTLMTFGSLEILHNTIVALNEGIMGAAVVELSDYNRYERMSGDGTLDNICIAALVERTYRGNVLVIRKDCDTSQPSTVIGAASLSGQRQIGDIYEHVDCHKYECGTNAFFRMISKKQIDGAVLPEENIRFLKLDRESRLKYNYLSTSVCVPQPGQGILGIIIRKDNPDRRILQKTMDTKTRIEYDIETQLINSFEWNEYMERDSVGVNAEISRNNLVVNMYVNYRKNGFKFTACGTYEYKDMVIQNIIKKVKEIQNTY